MFNLFSNSWAQKPDVIVERKPHLLSLAPNCDGRPVWGPPVFDYSDLIDDEYIREGKAF